MGGPPPGRWGDMEEVAAAPLDYSMVSQRAQLQLTTGQALGGVSH